MRISTPVLSRLFAAITPNLTSDLAEKPDKRAGSKLSVLVHGCILSRDRPSPSSPSSSSPTSNVQAPVPHNLRTEMCGAIFGVDGQFTSAALVCQFRKQRGH